MSMSVSVMSISVSVSVHLPGVGVGSSAGWVHVFLVLQASRLVWWSKEEDVDEGKAPAGQLLLFGHAGVSTTIVAPTSPICIFSNSYQYHIY